MQGQGQMDEMSMQVSFKFMNETMKDCFSNCITDFSKDEMNQTEVKCLQNCAKRSF